MACWFESVQQAMQGTAAPEAVQLSQTLLEVRHWSFSGQIVRGQLVLHRELAEQAAEIFQELLDIRFPIHSVLPAICFAWSDDASMVANNSSAFNYRAIVGKTELSRHALGRAIDINPVQNPYISGSLVLPAGARRDVAAPGTLIAGSPAVLAFTRRGWDWGGSWERLSDWHHFEAN
jgi:hypothetical protein